MKNFKSYKDVLWDLVGEFPLPHVTHKDLVRDYPELAEKLREAYLIVMQDTMNGLEDKDIAEVCNQIINR